MGLEAFVLILGVHVCEIKELEITPKSRRRSYRKEVPLLLENAIRGNDALANQKTDERRAIINRQEQDPGAKKYLRI